VRRAKIENAGDRRSATRRHGTWSACGRWEAAGGRDLRATLDPAATDDSTRSAWSRSSPVQAYLRLVVERLIVVHHRLPDAGVGGGVHPVCPSIRRW
jgi:hypothetical protein